MAFVRVVDEMLFVRDVDVMGISTKAIELCRRVRIVSFCDLLSCWIVIKVGR